MALHQHAQGESTNCLRVQSGSHRPLHALDANNNRHVHNGGLSKSTRRDTLTDLHEEGQEILLVMSDVIGSLLPQLCHIFCWVTVTIAAQAELVLHCSVHAMPIRLQQQKYN